MHCNTSTLAQLGRGALALAALVGAIVLTPHFWPAIGLLAVAFYFMRGCPACWVADLIETTHPHRKPRS